MPRTGPGHHDPPDFHWKALTSIDPISILKSSERRDRWGGEGGKSRNFLKALIKTYPNINVWVNVVVRAIEIFCHKDNCSATRTTKQGVG